jgi:hypothetical protein
MLYKKIKIDNFTEIQEELYKFLEQYYNGIDKEICTVIPTEDLDTPILNKFFKENNLHPDMCAVFCRMPGATIPIHLDGDAEFPRFLALNIPIANYKNTYMHWYNIPEEELTDATYQGNLFRGTSDALTPIDTLELDAPYLLRVDVPHNVTNNTDKIRLLLSIRFNPQPLHLWN